MFEARAIVISKEFEPWYEEERKTQHDVYWDDYETTCASQEVAGLLDHHARPDHHRRRRAADRPDPARDQADQGSRRRLRPERQDRQLHRRGREGDRRWLSAVIVLTGTIEILRAQTQRRIDMELMGVENILAGQDPTDPEVAKELDYQQDDDWLADKFVRHGDGARPARRRRASRRVTTHHSDYKSLPQGMSQLRFDADRQDRSRLTTQSTSSTPTPTSRSSRRTRRR